MAEMKIEIVGKKNMEKWNITFALIPTIGYMTDLKKNRIKHSLFLFWLFFEIDIYF